MILVEFIQVPVYCSSPQKWMRLCASQLRIPINKSTESDPFAYASAVASHNLNVGLYLVIETVQISLNWLSLPLPCLGLNPGYQN